jgi:inner membrane protein
VDNVTHSLIGLNLAEGFFKKRFPEAAPALVIASNIPDIDALILLSGDPLAVTFRRSFSHSVFTIPALCYGLAWLLNRRYKQSSTASLWILCMLGAYTHVFFDLVNSFGVVLFWPFTDWRPELAMVFIIDLVLLGLLVAPNLLRLVKSWRPALSRACRWSLGLIAAYLMFCAAARGYAKIMLDSGAWADDVAFSYIFPEPFGPHRWRLTYLNAGDGKYRQMLFHVFTGQADPAVTVETYPGDHAVLKARATTAGKRLEWFFKAPVWTSRPDGVHVHDLRFRSLLLKRGSSFEYVITPEGQVRR